LNFFQRHHKNSNLRTKNKGKEKKRKRKAKKRKTKEKQRKKNKPDKNPENINGWEKVSFSINPNVSSISSASVELGSGRKRID
jgi:hypothetical protein